MHAKSKDPTESRVMSTANLRHAKTVALLSAYNNFYGDMRVCLEEISAERKNSIPHTKSKDPTLSRVIAK